METHGLRKFTFASTDKKFQNWDFLWIGAGAEYKLSPSNTLNN